MVVSRNHRGDVDMLKDFSTKSGRISCWINPHDFGARGQSLVLIPGSGSNSSVWSRQYAKLHGRFNIAAVNLPGHGRSRGPGAASVFDYVLCLENILGALELEKPVLVGHSLGAAIALLFAATCPEALSGVVSIGGGLKMPVNPMILEGLSANPSGTKELIAKFSIAPANRPKMLPAIQKSLDQVAADVLLGDLTACSRLDLRGRLGAIRVPILAVCGAEDKMTPVASSQDLVANAADAELLVVENAGHMAMIEEPAIVNKAICAFAAKLIKETPS